MVVTLPVQVAVIMMKIKKLIWDKDRAKVLQVPSTWYLVSGQLRQLASVPGTIIIGNNGSS